MKRSIKVSMARCLTGGGGGGGVYVYLFRWVCVTDDPKLSFVETCSVNLARSNCIFFRLKAGLL